MVQDHCQFLDPPLLLPIAR